MGAIFGGKNNAAQKEAEKSRQLQQIANDRQLAALQAQDQDAATSRKAVRGRKLFADDTGGKSNLS